MKTEAFQTLRLSEHQQTPRVGVPTRGRVGLQSRRRGTDTAWARPSRVCPPRCVGSTRDFSFSDFRNLLFKEYSFMHFVSTT